MKISHVIRLPRLCLAVALVLSAVWLHGAEPDHDLFAPDRVIQIEVSMDPEDWQALRIEHRNRGEEVGTGQLAEKP